MMSKKLAFIILSVLAIAAFTAGRQLDEHFLADFWSELFMMIVGTLSTTFVLETILRHDAERRAREKDAFAFRTFAATMLRFLQDIVDVKPVDEAVFEAAISGKKQFESKASAVAAEIEQSIGFNADAYIKYNLDIESGLRGFSRNYIRSFC